MFLAVGIPNYGEAQSQNGLTPETVQGWNWKLQKANIKPGFYENVKPSPDGRYIYYANPKYEKNDVYYYLHRYEIATGQDRVLANIGKIISKYHFLDDQIITWNFIIKGDAVLPHPVENPVNPLVVNHQILYQSDSKLFYAAKDRKRTPFFEIEDNYRIELSHPSSNHIIFETQAKDTSGNGEIDYLDEKQFYLLEFNAEYKVTKFKKILADSHQEQYQYFLALDKDEILLVKKRHKHSGFATFYNVFEKYNLKTGQSKEIIREEMLHPSTMFYYPPNLVLIADFIARDAQVSVLDLETKKRTIIPGWDVLVKNCQVNPSWNLITATEKDYGYRSTGTDRKVEIYYIKPYGETVNVSTTGTDSQIPYRTATKVKDVFRGYEFVFEPVITEAEEPKDVPVQLKYKLGMDMAGLYACYDQKYLRFDIALYEPVEYLPTVFYNLKIYEDHAGDKYLSFMYEPATKKITYYVVANKKTVKEQELEAGNCFGVPENNKLLVSFILDKDKYFTGEKGKRYFLTVNATSFWGVNFDHTIKVDVEYER